MPQASTCKFNYKHVFLIGTLDPVILKEMLATRQVEVYLHDCEETVNKKSEERTFSKGAAQFTFRDFLRPFCREMKLRSDVFPVKKAEIDNKNNLNLNNTAKNLEKVVETASPYLVNTTYFIIQVNLACPIGSFNE